MKKVQISAKLRLLLSALALTIVTQSTLLANTQRTVPQVPFAAPQKSLPAANTGINYITKAFQPETANKTKALTDVTLLLTNGYPTDFDVFFYNHELDVYYDLNVAPHAYQREITVPVGMYDIHFYPNDMGKNHHWYSIGCLPVTGGGFATKNFYNVNITNEMYCNTIYFE